MRPDLKVLVQLPEGPLFDSAERELAARGGGVFRDAGSQNGKALVLALRATGVLEGVQG